MPEEYVRKGDPYEQHCIETTRLLREQLGFDENKLMLTFQSRFGRAKWLEPCTDQTVKALAKRGVKIARGRHARLLRRLPGDAGGDRGRERAHLPASTAARISPRIPCLNDSAPGMLVLWQTGAARVEGLGVMNRARWRTSS